MKKILFLLFILMGISLIGFSQNKTVIKINYIVIDENSELPKLDNLSDFKKKTKYSKINQDLIVDFVFEKKETEIWYYLLDPKDKRTYQSISNPNKRKDFVKKYGFIYRTNRKTQILYHIE